MRLSLAAIVKAPKPTESYLFSSPKARVEPSLDPETLVVQPAAVEIVLAVVGKYLFSTA